MLTRRQCLACLPLLAPILAKAAAGVGSGTGAGRETATSLQEAMQRARAMRDAAVRAGDQPYGAVVWRDGEILGEAPSRVVTHKNFDAHAEREAMRDALTRLRASDLAGCVLVSTSRPCGLCEAAAVRYRIARMVHGDALTDAGPPR